VPTSNQIYPERARKKTAYAERHLITKRKFGNKTKVIWRRDHSRTLTLASTWLGFPYIQNRIKSGTTKAWKQRDNLLWDWVKMLHSETQRSSDDFAKFDLPAEDDVLKQLYRISWGGPKMRYLFKFIAEIVVLREEKIIIWCKYPAMQQLLVGIRMSFFDTNNNNHNFTIPRTRTIISLAERFTH
jgi:hypothetical protein